MFDLWSRDTEIMLLLAVSAICIVMPIQLVLCFRAKRFLIKLLPAILLTVATVTFYAMILVTTDWSAFAYGILAIFSEVLLFFSAIAWGIWGIAKLIHKRKTITT